MTSSATRVVWAGSAITPLRRSAATRSSITSSVRPWSNGRPVSSTMDSRSPVGSKRTPRSEREDETSSASRAMAAW